MFELHCFFLIIWIWKYPERARKHRTRLGGCAGSVTPLLTGASFSAVFVPLPPTALLHRYLLCVDCFLRTDRPGAEHVPLCNLSLRHSLLLSCKSHAKLSSAFFCSQAPQRKGNAFLNEWPYFMHGAFQLEGNLDKVIKSPPLVNQRLLSLSTI